MTANELQIGNTRSSAALATLSITYLIVRNYHLKNKKIIRAFNWHFRIVCYPFLAILPCMTKYKNEV